MEQPDFTAVASITIKAPAERVWDALTDPAKIKRYLHDTDVETDWKVGSPITWRGIWDGKSYEDKGEILELEPNSLLKMTHWSPLSGSEDKPENYHTVSYQLTPHADDATHLVLTQTNNPSQEAADAMAENGWKPVLQALKSLLES